MELLIRPSQAAFKKASDIINLIDKTQVVSSSGIKILSKVAKDIKTIRPPVTRYFESPNQLTYMYAESEYDLVSVFKLLKHEPYFLKATQKKHGLLTKSGLSVHSDDDERNKYINSRFKIMQLETGYSIETLIKQVAYYLIVGSNGFLVKVRSDDPKYGTSYKKDGKEIKPIAGLFSVHPTTMKPKFKFIKDATQKTGVRLILDKWVHTNRRGIQKEFDPEDVVHFTLYKEDGMVFGMPEIIPVIDDIRTLRKIEEDVQLLVYRDLFPIIHYRVENPAVIDHRSGMTELEKAQMDMKNMIQDGGIATDKRHEIEFIGNQGKGVDVNPYLTYFKQRVFSGLGVSGIDLGEGDTTNRSTADTLSGQIIDAVKFIQQELAQQFKEKILDEMMMQSSYDDVFDPEYEVKLLFQEIDLEWKIRSENHEADLFSKGVKTIHETRNKMGHKDISDDDIEQYTFPGIQNKFDQKAIEAKGEQDASKADIIKKNKTNSNVTKSKDSIQLNDAEKSIALQDEFKNYLQDLYGKKNKISKIDIIFATKYVYDEIKTNMVDSFKLGMKDAAKDLGIEEYENNIYHNIFEPLDALRDNVADKVYKDKEYVNKAAVRIAAANKTEQSRAYNYGYSLLAVNNNKNKFIIYSDADIISEDSVTYIGKEIEVDTLNILKVIPPFRPNSRLKLKIVK